MLQSAAFPARERVSRGVRGWQDPRLPTPTVGAWARRVGSLALLAFTLQLVACESPPPPPLVLGMNSWVGYDPLVLARDRDMIDTAQIKVVELSSSSETMRGFRNGLIDAAALTLDEALRLAGEGQGLRLVALLDASAGADMVLARPGIDTLQALRGETIAVERSAVGALMLARLLQKSGLQPADVALSERPVQVDALIAGWREGLRALERDRAAVAVDMARGTT